MLCPDRAVYWPAGSALFIADPHFGKAATFRQVGLPVPEQTTVEDCARLNRLLDQTKAEILVILGDFLHSDLGRVSVVKDQLCEWRSGHTNLNIHLIRGNHDVGAGDPWPELGIECHDEPWRHGPWHCRHEVDEGTKGPQLAGHLHPSVSVAGERVACFCKRESHLILPAFGSFTGTHSVRPTERMNCSAAMAKRSCGFIAPYRGWNIGGHRSVDAVRLPTQRSSSFQSFRSMGLT